MSFTQETWARSFTTVKLIHDTSINVNRDYIVSPYLRQRSSSDASDRGNKMGSDAQ